MWFPSTCQWAKLHLQHSVLWLLRLAHCHACCPKSLMCLGIPVHVCLLALFSLPQPLSQEQLQVHLSSASKCACKVGKCCCSIGSAGRQFGTGSAKVTEGSTVKFRMGLRSKCSHALFLIAILMTDCRNIYAKQKA